MEKKSTESERPKPRAWMQKVNRGSFTSAQIATHLAKLASDRRAILDSLMTELVANASHLSYKWVKWGKAPGVHVSIPNTSKPFVVLAVVPMVERGIVVKARREIQGYLPNTDGELKFEKVIESVEDFNPVIARCISAQ